MNAEAKAITDEAIARAASSEAAAEWHGRLTLGLTLAMVESGEDGFTTDDVYRHCPELDSCPCKSALGAIVREFARNGEIRKTGQYRASERPSAHGIARPVWVRGAKGGAA